MKMKKYIKPTVEIVSLKSSEDIAAATYKGVRNSFINLQKFNTDYAITKYTTSLQANS